MNVSDLTDEQIRKMGLKVLLQALGQVGTIRFLQQFETGHGDYTQDRSQWLGNLSVDELVEKIESRRKAHSESDQ